MTSARIFIVVAIVLFGGIGGAAYFKKQRHESQSTEVVATVKPSPVEEPIEIPIEDCAKPQTQNEEPPHPEPTPAPKPEAVEPEVEVDQVALLFQKNSPLPIVETISYKSRVSWKPGRPAWLIDYASHYKTSIHFIARCLNQAPNYTPPPAHDGMQFNILSQKVDFHFSLLVDLRRLKMQLFAVLPRKNEKILLKSYNVGLGRPDARKTSGYLTPQGKYSLGSRVLVIQPKQMGNYKGKQVELIRVFGTRWIPFEKEVGTCSEPAKGFGLHGTPWEKDERTGALVDGQAGIGKYESDGCIRLKTEDIEELYSFVSTWPTFVEIN